MSDKFFSPGGYPANYFGKGKDFILPEDEAVLREFEIRFQEYELAHPEDPMGETALAKDQIAGTTAPTAPRAKVSAKDLETAVEPTEEKGDEDWVEIEMVLPSRHVDIFKRFCRFQRRRPRDVFMLWIDRHCKL